MSVDFPVIGGVTSDQLDPTASQPTNDNYLKTNAFKFNVDRCPTLTYFTQSVSLPGISVSSQQFATKYATPINIPSNLAEHGELSVRMIVDEKLRNWKEMYDWIKETVWLDGTVDGVDPNQYFSSANLLILNSGYNGVVDIEFANVFPTRLGDIPFTSSQTMTEVVVVDVSLSYSGYIVKDLT
jgi:hypothetical protein